MTIWELKSWTQMSWGCLYHHLAVLEATGEVRIVAAGRRRLLIPEPSGFTGLELQARALLRGETVERIAVAIVEGDDRTSVATLCETLHDPPRVVYYHVKRLIAARLVTSTSLTRRRGLRPTALLLLILDDRARSMAGTRMDAHSDR